MWLLIHSLCSLIPVGVCLMKSRKQDQDKGQEGDKKQEGGGQEEDREQGGYDVLTQHKQQHKQQYKQHHILCFFCGGGGEHFP